MAERAKYLTVAVLLTILGAVVAVYSSVAIWKAWAGDIWACALLAFFAALEATSLANVWAQTLSGLSASFSGRISECGRTTTPIPAEARGHSDV